MRSPLLDRLVEEREGSPLVLGHRGIEIAYLFRYEDRVVNLDDKKTLRYKINSWINRTGIKGFIARVDTLHPEITLFPENIKKGERLWMKAARLMDKRVNAWTVDSEEDLSKALASGVRVVISDGVTGAV
ncbi:MAG: hypothetical protein WBB19_05200 [Desulforhopalus sp.]